MYNVYVVRLIKMIKMTYKELLQRLNPIGEECMSHNGENIS